MTQSLWSVGLGCLLTVSAQATVFSGSIQAVADADGNRAGSSVDYRSFSVADAGAVTLDVLSWEVDDEDRVTGDGIQDPVDVDGDGDIAFFDPVLYLFRDDGSLGIDDLVASNNDSPQTYADGSISSLDPYLSLFLDAGSYLLAIGAAQLDPSEALTGFNDETFFPATCTLAGADCDFAPSSHGDYRVTLAGDSPPGNGIPGPGSLASIALGLGLLARRRFAGLAGAAALLGAQGAIACSLQFTAPGDGVTVMAPTVGVSGTGSGTANQGDVGTVTATVNGQVFFQQTGTFTGLINFFGSGAASATLRPGSNLLTVTGSAGSCSASDSMVVYYEPPPSQKDKAAGPPPCGGGNGSNPVNGGNGNKYQRETDYAGAGPFPLRFDRHYNSSFGAERNQGPHWRHSYDRQMAADASRVAIRKSDGRAYLFTLVSGQWQADADIGDRLERLIVNDSFAGWRLIDGATLHRETYDSAGRLAAIADPNGLIQTLAYDNAGRLVRVADPGDRQLLLGYDGNGRLASLTDPAGGVIRYGYDAAGRLLTATYQDGTVRTYRYEDSRFPSALTGIDDEAGVRAANWAYDGQGRAISSEHAAGTDRYSFTYNADGSTGVTDPLGTSRRYDYTTLLGVARTTGVDRPCAVCGNAAGTLAYDGHGNVVSRTDFNGHTSTYTYDLSRNLEISRTEAAGTPDARTIVTTWHPSVRLPSRIDEPGRTTEFTYDSQGRLLTRSDTDTATSARRTWTLAYTAQGLLASEDGPRQDVADLTRYGYDAHGNLATVTDAEGHTATYADYDPHGRPRRIVDANGVASALAYDARGRLVSHSVAGHTATYRYSSTGHLLQETLPDGAVRHYGYDTAGRLADIRDGAGNRQRFVYDDAGNQVREDVYDAAGNLARSRAWTYDTLSRLVASRDASGRATTYAYDAQGNLVTATDPLGHATYYDYDALDRQAAMTDPAGGVTRMAYDAHDRLTAVTDARMNTTGYTYDGFGNLIGIDSPDSGDSSYTYDAAGNRIGSRDAAGIAGVYTYDPLNRLLTADYPGSEADIAYTYDQGTNGKGRLTAIVDAATTTDFTYSPTGQVVRQLLKKGRIVPKVPIDYAYDAADRIVRIVYASTVRVDYLRNGDGRIVRIDATWVGGRGGTTRTVADGIEYAPFGPLKRLVYGNGLVLERTYDGDGRLASQRLKDRIDQAYAYDAAGNLAGIADQIDAARSQSFAYDALDRLAAASGSYGNLAWDYDGVGNRTRETRNGQISDYRYGAGDNRLAAIVGAGAKTYAYDANGNTTQAGSLAYLYRPDGRLKAAQRGSLVTGQYGYDGLGRRITKTAAGSIDYFAFDPAGKLLFDGTYSYVYLDDLPIAMLRGDFRHYLHPGHIGMPVQASDETGAITWAAAYEPFGKAISAASGIAVNLRLPGQYYDAETGGHYNYFRDYDPTTGRYLEGDPIGLVGGVNLYTYAGGNPASMIDPLGFDAIYINYDYYPINTPVGQLPLGHGAVVALDPSSGHTQYYEFGRYGDPNGVVRGAPDIKIPNVFMGDDGLPTQASLNRLYDYLSRELGKGSHVSATYYPDSDYRATTEFAERFRTNHPNYDILTNNCKTFGRAAATACKEGAPCK